MEIKEFKYDTLLSPADICNLQEERKRLQEGVRRAEKMVVYGKRNVGKTSVVLNVIAADFKRKNKKSFVFFADLMQVRDFPALSERLEIAFERAFEVAFPGKHLVQAATSFLKSLRPSFELDPISGQTSLSIRSAKGRGLLDFEEIFHIINEQIAPKAPSLIVLDEFQDISFVEGAEGRMRSVLQAFDKVPVILLGSKKHLLSKMFAVPNAPFSDFGKDIEFGTIRFEEYHDYIIERFAPFGLKINFETSRFLQTLMRQNPEAINILGAQIVSDFRGKVIQESDVKASLLRLLTDRRSRFETVLARLSPNEQEIMAAIAKLGPIKEPTGKVFLAEVSPTHGTVRKVIKQLEDEGFIEWDDLGYQVSSPLLGFYLQQFRLTKIR